MRGIIPTHTKTHRYLFQFLFWGVALPIAFFLNSIWYEVQKEWSDTFFVCIYLLVYLTFSLLAILIRHSKSELPTITLWFTSLFILFGLSRIGWMLVQIEYNQNLDASFGKPLWTMLLGSLSLFALWYWEHRRDQNTHASQTSAVVYRKRTVIEPQAPVIDEVSMW